MLLFCDLAIELHILQLVPVSSFCSPRTLEGNRYLAGLRTQPGIGRGLFLVAELPHNHEKKGILLG